jgi:hypothetical protein
MKLLWERKLVRANQLLIHWRICGPSIHTGSSQVEKKLLVLWPGMHELAYFWLA